MKLRNLFRPRKSTHFPANQSMRRQRRLGHELLEQRELLTRDVYALAAPKADPNGVMDLYKIDTLSAAPAFIASTGTIGLRGLAVDPANGTLFTSHGVGGSIATGIATIDPSTGAVTNIGGPTKFTALDFDSSGQLFGAEHPGAPGGSPINVHKVDKTTGNSTILTSIPFSTTENPQGPGLAFDGTDLIYKGQFGTTWRIDPITGSTALLPSPVSVPSLDGHSLAMDIDYMSGGSAVFSEHPNGADGSAFSLATAGNFFSPTLVGETSLSIRGLSFDDSQPIIASITVPTDPVNIQEQPIVASATFSAGGGSHSCTIDYGDATGQRAGNVIGTMCIGPDHEYADPGVYQVTVAVTNGQGDVGIDTADTYVVIYDPSGGHVTGGGWLHSVAGAYRDDLSIEGKATFGFVSKYKKGAAVPIGSTQFTFKIGNLNFHSTSYDFLVVNQGGSNAQFKGTGTINGLGEYKFMVWASESDDGPDEFRIKIWQDTGEETVIYDNGDDSWLGGGSIHVHKAK